MARSKSPTGSKGTRANATANPTTVSSAKEQPVNSPIEAGVSVRAPETNSVVASAPAGTKPQGEVKAQAGMTSPAATTRKSEIEPKSAAKPQAETKPQAEAKPEPHRLEVMKADARKNLVPINLEDEIRRRAYELYQQRGSNPGSEAEDWFAAEREIRQRYRQQSA